MYMESNGAGSALEDDASQTPAEATHGKRRAAGRVKALLQRQRRQLLIDTILLGVTGVVAAQLFNLLLDGSRWLFLYRIAGYRPPGLPSEGASPIPVVGARGVW